MKKRKAQKASEKDKRDIKVNRPETPESTNESEKMNFGGLPNRDLKKNLGCG